MKLSGIMVICALNMTVYGTWWVGIVQPILLSFGATFAALDLDLEPIFDV